MQNLFREEAVSWNVCSQLFVMDWPEKTQDIKTIVLLLEQLDWMVWEKKNCPSSKSNLWDLLQVAWSDISADFLNKPTAILSKVCKAVVAANVGFVDERKV